MMHAVDVPRFFEALIFSSHVVMYMSYCDLGNTHCIDMIRVNRAAAL